MVAERQPATKVMVVNLAARSTGADDLQRLSTAFPDCLVLTVGGDEDIGRLLAGAAMTEDALVVAVGGDGTVEAVFEGEPDAVESLVDFSRSGPSLARVERVDVSDEQPEGLSGFDVR